MFLMETKLNSMKKNELFNEIRGIDLVKIPNGAHQQFFKYVCSYIGSETALLANDRVKMAVDKLEKALAEEERCMRLSKKSMTTNDIKDVDRERDSLFVGFKAAVRSFLRISIPEMKQAATELHQRIKESRINPRAQLERETANITVLIEDCEGRFAPQVAKLGLQAYVEALKSANCKVEELLLSRINARQGRRVGERRLARRASDEAYLKLVKIVNSISVLGIVPDLDRFLNRMNYLIKRYKEQVLTKRKRKKKNVAQTPNDASPNDKNTEGENVVDDRNHSENKALTEENISAEEEPQSSIEARENDISADKKVESPDEKSLTDSATPPDEISKNNTPPDKTSDYTQIRNEITEH